MTTVRRPLVDSGPKAAQLPLELVYAELERRGFSAENAIPGMGGGLLQHCNRDTMNFGQKASAVCVNGEWRTIAKAPTGDAMKGSERGRLGLRLSRESISPGENILLSRVGVPWSGGVWG
ncbi:MULTISPECIES: nicotinate phosphoribosyltransferase [Rhodococcus]|uniref:Putative nicotinate phosphoribosyltransferase n=1 Tax=Rhodococcus opacus RKJ300 = JCM 13270 TaxID=1165867 RepID=I0WUJ4_RHOOP|nr:MULTISPECIES: nicotinate phosphoribosyltransferase [Rhodococcus]EID80060.1 putative nicotinate phosphoribosyltransferase [Rhodococcus opacus RKJ300 = JCM 13270]QQZ14598.1 nicotinate phosphoribosyltransferase [Rhodococcus sp. 21391]